MKKPEDVTAAIRSTRIKDMRVWIEPRLPGMSNTELHDEWIYAFEGGASFAGDPPWLDLVESEYARRGLEPGASIAAND